MKKIREIESRTATTGLTLVSLVGAAGLTLAGCDEELSSQNKNRVRDNYELFSGEQDDFEDLELKAAETVPIFSKDILAENGFYFLQTPAFLCSTVNETFSSLKPKAKEELEDEIESPTNIQELSAPASNMYKRLSKPNQYAGFKKQFTAAKRFDAILKEKSQKYDIPYSLLVSVIVIESGGDPSLKMKTSSATGLMQILDATAKEQGCYHGRKNPEINVECGAKYLKLSYDRMRKVFKRHKLTEEQLWDLAMAGYNRGSSGAIEDMVTLGCQNLEELHTHKPKKYSYAFKARAVERLYFRYLEEMSGAGIEVN